MKKFLLGLLVAVALIGMMPDEAAAQGCTNARAYVIAEHFTGLARHRIRSEAITGCDQAEARAWQDIPFGCYAGAAMVGGECITTIGGTNANAYAGARGLWCGAMSIGGEALGHVPNTSAWITTEPFFFESYVWCPPPESAPESGCTWVVSDYETGDGYWSCSPIIIYTGPKKDLHYRLTSAQNGVVFDIDADGALDQTAWTHRGDDIAFLAIDRNGNGVIDDGSELLGSSTVPGISNGFEALAHLAKEANGGVQRVRVSSLDGAFFDSLLLWTDKNHDGVSQPRELEPFGVKFSGIQLGYTEKDREDKFGNQFRYKGYVQERTAPGENPILRGETERRSRKVFDVFLVKQ